MRYLIVIASMNVIKYGFYYEVWGLYCTLVHLNFPSSSQCSSLFFRHVTIVNVTWYILSPSSSIKRSYCPAKCFKNKILLYHLTFPRRKTSAVITASISSAPSAKITSALPFKSAMLDEQRSLVPRPLISQMFFSQ